MLTRIRWRRAAIRYRAARFRARRRRERRGARLHFQVCVAQTAGDRRGRLRRWSPCRWSSASAAARARSRVRIRASRVTSATWPPNAPPVHGRRPILQGPDRAHCASARRLRRAPHVGERKRIQRRVDPARQSGKHLAGPHSTTSVTPRAASAWIVSVRACGERRAKYHGAACAHDVDVNDVAMARGCDLREPPRAARRGLRRTSRHSARFTAPRAFRGNDRALHRRRR